MAELEFKLPDIGEGVTEGEIVEWFVAVGDTVREDDPMVEVMTDKATVTIGAPCDARVSSLRFEVGQVAPVGQIILTLDTAQASRAPSPDSTPPPESPAATAVGDIRGSIPGAGLFGDRNTVRQPAAATAEVAYFQAKPLASPATRRLAREMGVDLRRVTPSGDRGQVTKDDVRASPGDRMAPDRPHEALEERVPIVGLRRRIAERMAHAKATAAHFTFVEECDASRLVDLRERLAPEASRRGIHLTYLPFIVKAVTEALQRHPVLNSAVDEQTNELVYKTYIHIGIATATEQGLVVPVLRNANRMSLLEVAGHVERLGREAREGSLRSEDLRNSTFTITSLGKQSGLLATPILNHPEVGILGVHRIKDKPVVREGSVVAGKIMLLSLSFDHRIVDGHVGAAFAYDVIEMLENPERISGDAP